MRSFADFYYARVQDERSARFKKPTQVHKKGTEFSYTPKATAATSSTVLANIRPRQFFKFSLPLSKVFERLCKSGVMKPMEPRLLPNTLSP